MQKVLIFLGVWFVLNYMTNKHVSKNVITFRDLLILTAVVVVLFYSYSMINPYIPHSNYEDLFGFFVFTLGMIALGAYIVYKYRAYSKMWWVVAFDMVLAYNIAYFIYTHFNIKTAGFYAFLLLVYLLYTLSVIVILKVVISASGGGGSFFLSMFVSALTGSVIFGYIIGEDLFGALLGKWLFAGKSDMPNNTLNNTDENVFGVYDEETSQSSCFGSLGDDDETPLFGLGGSSDDGYTYGSSGYGWDGGSDDFFSSDSNDWYDD